LDAAATLASLLVDHRPNPALFNSVVGGLIRDATTDGRRIRVYGEMVALLWEAGQVTAAMELESLWNGIGARVQFSLFCAYPATATRAGTQALEHLCGLHSSVIGALPGSTRCPRIHLEVASRRFDGQWIDPKEARRFTVDALTSCGWQDIANDAAIVVTELAANAVTHAHSPFTVTLSSRGDGVMIAVRDDSPLAPDLRDPASSEVRGRGLRLVAALSASWGTDLEEGGKVVWAELVP
jgi:anti-sigma regulatory factor (Ser/Thr protein kinase)